MNCSTPTDAVCQAVKYARSQRNQRGGSHGTDANKLKHGHVDDDALTFAIFTHDGRMVLNDGDNGEDIPYSYQREGFADGQLVGDKDQWRFV